MPESCDGKLSCKVLKMVGVVTSPWLPGAFTAQVERVMNDTTDLIRATLAVRHFENLLRDRYRARGSGLTSRTKSVSRNLNKDIVNQLLYIASVRNEMVHEKVNSFPDKHRFEEACAELEEFFKEAITSEPIIQPTWLKPIHVGFLPKPLESTYQYRLYTLIYGRVKIYEEGSQKIRRVRGMTESGFVCMIPQALARLEIAPLRSKDGLSLTMSIETSAFIVETEQAITTVILAIDQQIETLKSQILLVLQELCSKMEYDIIFRSLHEVATKLKNIVNAKVTESSSSFALADCAITECDLEDSEIEDIRRYQRRSVEETKKKMEEQEYLTHLERLQQEAQAEKDQIERSLKLDIEKHSMEIQKLKTLAEEERNKAEIKSQKEKEKHKQELAVLASAKSIEVEKYKSQAAQYGLDVIEARAKIVSQPGGKYVMYPDKSHDIERSRLIQNAELIRATLSEKKVLLWIQLAASAGFKDAEVEILKSNFQHIFAETRQLTEMPETKSPSEKPPENEQDLRFDSSDGKEDQDQTNHQTEQQKAGEGDDD